MKAILLTELKISLAIAIFFVVYRITFGSDTFFVRNRLFLLVAIVVSFVSPWLTFVTKVYRVIPEINYLPERANLTIPVLPANETSVWALLMKTALGIYLAGVLFYLVRLVWAYHKVIRLIITSEKKKFQELILVITRLSVTPFSLLKWLVVPSHQVDHPGFENIVQHESIHCRQYHSVDLFLAELMVIFQWFNPFAWWLKKSMVENHEFIVDREILQHGMDSRKYQYLLLHLSTGSYQPASVNYFNTNLLKKRIRMMNKTKSPTWYGVKNGMVFLSIAIVVALTATFETKVIAQEPGSDPLVIINGKKSDMKTLAKINPDNIQSVNVTKDTAAIRNFGKDAKNGAIEVITRDTLNPFKSSTMPMEEVKVTGQKKHQTLSSYALTGEYIKDKGILTLKDSIIFHGDKKPFVILDGKKIGHLSADEINSYKAHKVIILEGKRAEEEYGEDGENGVLLLFTSDEDPGNKEIKIPHEPASNTPLYLMDGTEVSEKEFMEVKPDDIYSINILKDKSTTVIYGDKGKNGVIMMTLKKEAVQKKVNNLVIAPNPASDNVEISLSRIDTKGNSLDVKVYNCFQREVFNDKKIGPTFTLSVSKFPTGRYYIVVSDGSKVYQGNLSVTH